MAVMVTGGRMFLHEVFQPKTTRNAMERLVELAQTVGGIDSRPINTNRGQGHARRAPDETSEQDDVQSGNKGVKQLIGADRSCITKQLPRLRLEGCAVVLGRSASEQFGSEGQRDRTRCGCANDGGQFWSKFSKA